MLLSKTSVLALVIGGAAAAAVVLVALKRGAAAAAAALNPLDSENVINKGVTAVGTAITGDQSFSLGAKLFEFFNPAAVQAEREAIGAAIDKPRTDTNTSSASATPSPATTPAPGPRPVLRRGDRGDAVVQLQRLLGLSADGIFGSNTELAIKSFQSSNGLVVDGVVGPATWSALDASITDVGVPSVATQIGLIF